MDNGDTSNPELTGNIRNEQGQFIPGISGNPKGRTPGSGISITTEIKRKLAEVPPGQKASYLELLVARIMKQAVGDGDTQMITKIWNYIDGMPMQNMDVKGVSNLLILDGTNNGITKKPDELAGETTNSSEPTAQP